MKVITYNDIEKVFTDKLSELISNGCTVSMKTSSGGDDTLAKIDLLTPEQHLLRLLIDEGRIYNDDVELMNKHPKLFFGSRMSAEVVQLKLLDYGKVPLNLSHRTRTTYWSKSDDRNTELMYKAYFKIGQWDSTAFVETIEEYCEYKEIRKTREIERNYDNCREIKLNDKLIDFALKLRLKETGYKSYKNVMSIKFRQPEYFDREDKLYISSKWENGDWVEGYYVKVDKTDIKYGGYFIIKYNDGGYGHQKVLTKHLSNGWRDNGADLKWLATVKEATKPDCIVK